MPRLTITIPAIGNWESLEATLVSVLQYRPYDSEVMVALNRPYDDPYDLSGEVRFLELPRRSRFVDLANAGFAAAGGDIVHVLAAGAQASENWVEPALRHFSEPQVSLVAPLMVDSGHTRVVAAGCAWSRGGKWSAFGAGATLEKPLTTGRDWVGPDLLAGFYRRATLAEVGALDATLPAELAAIDLGLRVRQVGRRALLEPACRVTVEERIPSPAGSFSQGWHAERLFWRHLCGGNTASKLAAHAFAVVFEAAGAAVRPANAVRAAGRIGGLCDPRRPRRTALADSEFPAQAAANDDRRVDGPHLVGSPARGGRASINSFSHEATS
ncbi:MAG TPA: glycosyltransferase [Pirellulales bacterium]